jgi:hypothetical protein
VEKLLPGPAEVPHYTERSEDRDHCPEAGTQTGEFRLRSSRMPS